ncbi:hypothetical protein HDU92_006841 [Lobulomyces angularis]|nr:hypothetical protein HDU92_006841 [Lobulomyces angularis]
MYFKANHGNQGTASVRSDMLLFSRTTFRTLADVEAPCLWNNGFTDVITYPQSDFNTNLCGNSLMEILLAAPKVFWLDIILHLVQMKGGKPQESKLFILLPLGFEEPKFMDEFIKVLSCLPGTQSVTLVTVEDNTVFDKVAGSVDKALAYHDSENNLNLIYNSIPDSVGNLCAEGRNAADKLDSENKQVNVNNLLKCLRDFSPEQGNELEDHNTTIQKLID